MNPEDTKSLDLLGVRPLARAADRVTESSLAGASAFLSKICLPAAEEFGLLLRDRVSHWRAKNAAAIVARAEMIVDRSLPDLEAHPRLVSEIIERGSWTDDEVVQKLWAGLLASSCTVGGGDDSNILFTSILEQLTSVQVRILLHACESSPKYVTKAGLPLAGDFQMPLEELMRVSGVTDIHRLDRELDHLRSMELIGGPLTGGGFSPDSTTADVSVTALALHLYVRAQGFRGSPVEYWTLKPKGKNEPTPESSASP
jgi:hypothetical protein